MNLSATGQRLRSPLFLVPLLLLLAIALGTLWFFHNFEKKKFEVHQGASPAALSNPLLAAERYLQASGQPAESQHGMKLFSKLPPPQDALLIRYLPGGLSKSISDNLIGWVEAGGHLLLVPNPLGSDHPGSNTILDRLGVGLQENEDDSDCGCPPKKEEVEETADESEITTETGHDTVDSENLEAETAVEDDGYHPYNSIIDLRINEFNIKLETFSPTLLDDQEQNATYRIDGSYHIEFEDEADKKRDGNHREVTEQGAWLLQYQVGAGKVTVLSEMTLFYNDYIGEYDHAFFLSWLLREADQVWLLYATGVDSLTTILWNRFPFFWISLFTLTFLILWKLQKRSGSLAILQSEQRHNIMDHIEASGHYNWRLNRLSAIVDANRRTLLQWWADRKLGQRHGRENINFDVAFMADKMGISKNETDNAFRQRIDSEQDLIQTSRALQRIQTLIQGGESSRDDR